MSRFVSILFLIFSISPVFAQLDSAKVVQALPQISLLTCDAGDQLYSTFGHSAIRIKDVHYDRDLVFNYGTFSFREPGFYTKFVRGKLLYKLGVSTFDQFLAEYNYTKRGVIEQVFELDSIQTYKMMHFLEKNYQPENRSYKYDFFFDNCSTRIRDIFEQDIPVKFNPESKEMTFRDQLDENLVPMPWSDFGIDLVIGARADQVSDYRNQMFLPAYLSSNLASATLDGKPLIRETNTVFSFSDAKAVREQVSFFTPSKLFLGMSTLLLLLGYLYRSKSVLGLHVISRIWFLVLGILSLVMLFLWFGTDHIATKANWNLIWCSPLFLILVFRYKSIRSSLNLQRLVKFLLVSSVVYILLGYSIAPQDFPIYLFAFTTVQIVLLLWQLSLFSDQKNQAG